MIDSVNELLASYSIVGVYSAMALYTLAFIAYALDLAGRSAAGSVVRDAAPVVAGRLTAAVAGREARANGGVALAEHTTTDAPPPPAHRSATLRVAVALTVIGFLLHLASTIARGVAAGGRVPWANMYEFSLTMTLIVVGVFLGVLFVRDLRFLGTFVLGLVLLVLGVSTVSFYVGVVPLPPALQSPWLIIHVFVASLATGFLALGAALSALQLLQTRYEAGGAQRMRFLASIPASEQLERLAYRLIIVGFIFWTFTLMAGAIWAERAWGRYWGWDTKEVWTFIIWVIFAGYIHARVTRGWQGARSAWLAIIGFSAVLFNFTIVNLFFKGLHAYSGL